ncbi:hypothetical protein C8Q76DRAFT_315888 [Earliella scabrosa]|nr:hypothetical protein C8Q76DRAFT_315888 [Earliella scabrosa]
MNSMNLSSYTDGATMRQATSVERLSQTRTSIHSSGTASVLVAIGSPVSTQFEDQALPRCPDGFRLDEDHAYHTPALRDTCLYPSPSTPESRLLPREVAGLSWHAPVQLQDRARALLQAMSAGSPNPHKPAHNVDSGLRLYDGNALPPPYSAA